MVYVFRPQPYKPDEHERYPWDQDKELVEVQYGGEKGSTWRFRFASHQATGAMEEDVFGGRVRMSVRREESVFIIMRSVIGRFTLR
jgi:hypothetical protein